MRIARTSLLLCLMTPAAALHAAEAYKCVDANGNTTLTDVPCHTLPNKQPPPPAGQAKPPETLKPPKPEPILPPAGQQLQSPPAPSPAAPSPGTPIKPRVSPTQG